MKGSYHVTPSDRLYGSCRCRLEAPSLLGGALFPLYIYFDPCQWIGQRGQLSGCEFLLLSTAFVALFSGVVRFLFTAAGLSGDLRGAADGRDAFGVGEDRFGKVWIAHLDLALSSPEPRRDDARSAHRARMPVIAATRKRTRSQCDTAVRGVVPSTNISQLIDLTPAHSWLFCVVRPRCLSTDVRQEGRRWVTDEEKRETRWVFGKLDAGEAPAIVASFCRLIQPNGSWRGATGEVTALEMAGAEDSQPPPQQGPTMRAACKTDMQSLCPGLVGKDARKCLKEHSAQLSAECTAFFEAKARRSAATSGSSPSGGPPSSPGAGDGGK